MNTRYIPAAIIVALLAGTAVAEPLPAAAHGQAARCVDALRGAIREAGTVRIRHTITGIRTVGARRAFVIESSAWEDGAGRAREFTSRCLADRWGEGVELAWVRPAAAPGPDYVAGVRK